MQRLPKLLFERPKDTGSRFGFVSILLIAIAIVFPVFYGLGSLSPMVVAYTSLLLAGLVMSIFFSYMYGNITRTKRAPRGLSAADIQKQFSVVYVGIIAGLVLVIVNGLTNIGGNYLMGSATGIGTEEVIYLALLAGVAEELFFRGFIQTMIRIYVPSLIFAIVPSALIFALFHYFTNLSATAFVVLFFMGIILGLLHELFNDIGVPMIAHIVNNVFSMLGTVVILITGNLFIIIGITALAVGTYIVVSLRRGK